MTLRLEPKKVLDMFLSGRELNVIAEAYLYDQEKNIREAVIRFWFTTPKSLYSLVMISHFMGRVGLSATMLQAPHVILIRSKDRSQTTKALPPTFSIWEKLYPLLSENWKEVERRVESRIRQADECAEPNCKICAAVVPSDFKVFLTILKGIANGPPANVDSDNSLGKIQERFPQAKAVVLSLSV